MDTYVGLDVSLRETAVCVVDESGAIQLERTVAAIPTLSRRCSTLRRRRLGASGWNPDRRPSGFGER